MSSLLPHGVVDQTGLGRKDDHLYRVSIKGLIQNEKGEVLVVKEAGRTWWDLPGGGMDHGENIRSAIARELHEEVGLTGEFTYEIIDVDEPMHLPTANVIQIRLIFAVEPSVLPTTAGVDADAIEYINPAVFRQSNHPVENKIHEYVAKHRDK